MWQIIRLTIRPAVFSLVFFGILTGLIYPLVVTGIAQTFFKEKANGSLIYDNQSNVIGSELIGQEFNSPKYFWGRLSATGSFAYNGLASGGSNYAPINPALQENAKARIEKLQAFEIEPLKKIPVELVSASASGLDPHISVRAANYQISRIAKYRGIDPQRVKMLIEKNIESPVVNAFLNDAPGGIVNVLKLNLALDQMNP